MSDSKPSEEEVRNKTRKLINLKCLQKLFKGTKDIVSMSKSSAAYYFDISTRIWLKIDAAGSLFVCSSTEDSILRVILMNQNDNKDICLRSDEFMKIRQVVADNMLHIYLKNGAIKGFWISEPEELARVYQSLTPFVADHKTIPVPSNPTK